MKKNMITLASLALLAVVLLLAAGCGTFFSVRMTSPRSWLEGKDYVVQFSMANAEKAQKVTLYYRVNDQAYQVVEPVVKGALREYTIPAAQLAPGRLEYYVLVVDDKGKEYKDGLVSVSILSLAQGKAQAEQDLARRFQVNAPKEIEIISNLDITARVIQPRAGTTVTVSVKNPSAARYRTQTLTPQAGEYRLRIPAADLEEGALSYYFTLSENHPDFGPITTTYPGNAFERPLSVNVIGLKEMADRMAAELAAAVTHQPPTEVLSTQNLEVSLALNIPAGSLLERLLTNDPQVTIYYGRKSGRARFRGVPMSRDRQGTYTAVIDRRSLSTGVDSYYFNISALTRDVGTIETMYPAPGADAPFQYRLVSLSEMRSRRLQEYGQKISHTPPAASQAEPLELELGIKDAPASRRGELYFKMASERTYRNLAMRSTARGLVGIIPAADLHEGVLTYYFTITLGFSDVGQVIIPYPPQGSRAPLKLNVASAQEAIRQLEENLNRRISHQPVKEVPEGQGFEIVCTIKDMKPGTSAVAYLKRGMKPGFTARPMRGVRGGFSTMVSALDVKAGYDAYYIEVTEPHPRFKNISASLPRDGKDKPFVVTVRQADKKPEQKPDKKPEEKPDTSRHQDLLDSIVFDHVKEPVPGRPLAIRVQIKKAVAGMKVELAYRVGGGNGKYLSLALAARGINYSGTMAAALLTEGVTIEYYFIITLPGEKEALTYPAEDKIPLSFTVPGTGADKKDKDNKGRRGR